MTRHLSFILTLAAMLSLTAAPAFGATITVGPGGGYDHATIQAAVNAASPSGDDIVVAAGLYPEQVTIVAKSLTLTGAGEGTTTIQAPTSGRATITIGSYAWDYVVAADGNGTTRDVKIEGFTIDANGEDGDLSHCFTGVLFRDIGGSLAGDDGLYSCTVNNFGSFYGGWEGAPYETFTGNSGVVAYGTCTLTLHDNAVDDFTVHGLALRGASSAYTVSQNDLNGFDAHYCGLFVRDASAAITDANTIRNLDNNGIINDGSHPGIGIYLYETTASGVTISNANTIRDNVIGLWLAGTDGASIAGNTFTDNEYRSIIIQQDSDNNSITDNTITMTGADVMNAIYIGGDSGGNTIGGAAPADGNDITIPTNTTQAAHMPYVIHLATGGAHDNAIRNNTITNGARAIQIDGGNTGTYTIADNYITNDGTNGIGMTYAIGMNAGNGVISGNTMANTYRPFECFGAGTIVFTGNAISGISYFGLNLGSYTGDPVVTGNAFLGFGGNGNVVWNQGSGDVDATSNWWGDLDPSDNVNPGAGTIDYSPWWGANYVGDDHSSAWTWYTDDSIQDAIGAASSGDIIYVAVGTYAEHLTVNKSLDLRGAQLAVDPTQPGARTNPALESIVDITGISVQNPNVAVEIPNGVTDVTFGGFTVLASPTSHYADECAFRCWDDNLTIEDNIIDGYFGVLYKGADVIEIGRNRIEANKGGITVQPNAAADVTISGNLLTLGSSPAGDESAIYMTSCTDVTVSGNTASGWVNGKGAGGSNLTNASITGNTFTGNKDAVSFWGNTTFVTISENDLSGSSRFGVSLKGQDLTIAGNVITGCGDTGVNIDHHVIDTERVTVYGNDLSGNTNAGLAINTGSVTETVNASGNWWGSNIAADVRAEANAGDGADYTPWLDLGADTSTDIGFQGDFSELWVDDDSPQTGPATRLQEGADLATGSTVNVLNGSYGADPATGRAVHVTTDGLNLVGESEAGTIIDGAIGGIGSSGSYWPKGIHVQANNVTVRNFTVQGFTGDGASSGGYGVLHRDYDHDTPGEGYIFYDGCTAENITSQNNCYPMYALCFTHLEVANCTISNNQGDGMFIARGCGYANIHDNVVTNSGDHGIWVGKCWTGLDPSDNATITGNTVNGAREGGISFVGSDGATIEWNTITNAAGEGWSVGALSLKDGASNVTARYNVIHGNDGTWGGYAGTGHGIGIDGTPSNIVLNWNCIYDNAGYGCYNYSTVTVDAKYCWWGDASGPDTGAKGTGDEVTDYVDYDPWIGKAGTGNIVFLPDPDYFSSTSEARTMVVRYLGGASGPIHSWELLIDRDGTIVGAGNVAAPTSGPFAGGTAIINAVNHPTENKKIVSGTLTTGDAYWGTCDLFRVDYSSVAEGVANIAIEVSYFRSCPFITCDLEGAVGDPGEMRVDLTNPAVSVVEFTNETLTHTNDWVKVGDDGSLIARVVEADPYMTATDFEVNLSGLGLGAAVNPDVATYDSGNGWYDLTWNTFGVTNATVETDLKTLTVTATDGAGHVGTGDDTVTLDNEAPAVPTDLTAAPGHQKTTLGWTHGTDAGQYDGTIVVYTTPYGTYPDYDAPNWPPINMGADPTLTASEGEAYGWGNDTSVQHSVTPRDVYRYAAFGRDMARNYSAASDMADATNYWLGDVAGGSPYDGEVETADISALGSSYYKHLAPPYNHECDVAQSAAPQNPLGIPAPDMQIDFEDLMIFALNFGNVSPLYLPAAVSVDSEVGDVALYLQLPDKLAVGSEFTAAVMLKDESGLVQGTHFRVAYFPGVLEFVRASEGALVSGCDAVFFKALEVEDLPDVSAAVLGSGITFGHSGELARLTFRIVGEGDIRLELQDVSARNVLNEELLTYSSDVLVGGGGTEVMIPTQVYLRGNQPNPFTGATTIAFGLPQEGLVRLAIYDVSGRMVRTLINGTLPAAEHVLSWDRRDDSGHAVSGGVYLYRLQTSEKTITKKMVVSN